MGPLLEEAEAKWEDCLEGADVGPPSRWGRGSNGECDLASEGQQGHSGL